MSQAVRARLGSAAADSALFSASFAFFNAHFVPRARATGALLAHAEAIAAQRSAWILPIPIERNT